MSGCIFCRIVAGEVPAATLIDDADAFAFMDIGPVAEGHVLLIPPRHYETLDQMPPTEAAALLRYLPPLVGAVKAVTGCAGVNVLQNNGRAAHQVVPHVHFHIIPRRAGDAFSFNWPTVSYAEGRMAALAAAIRARL